MPREGDREKRQQVVTWGYLFGALAGCGWRKHGLRPMSGIISWGILGTGKIARKFAGALAVCRTGRLAAVGSRTPAKALEFVRDLPGVRAHGSYAELLADPGVDVVYIATPHTEHRECTLRAATAGRHIVCEKPLAMNGREVAQMIAAARRAGVFLMEAMMFRCHPQTQQLAAAIQAGAIGELRVIEATFVDRFPFSGQHRAYNLALGGGGILDLGCYPASFARLMAGAATGQAVAEPIQFAGAGRLNEATGVDEYAAATALFPSGIVAQLACGLCARQEATARLYGTEGWLEVPEPFVPGTGDRLARFFVHRHGGGAPLETVVPAANGLYSLEIDAVGAALASGAREAPQIPLADSLGNLRMLDSWRAQVGVRYDADSFVPCRIGT